MTPITALHTAARRYCRTRHDYYWNRHTTESHREQDEVARYIFLSGALLQIERHTPSDFATLAELQNALFDIAKDGDSDESRILRQYIINLSPSDLATIEPLPYRRILTPSEHTQIESQLKQRWGIDGHWHPFMGTEPPPDVLAFHTDFFDDQMAMILRTLLGANGVDRLLELRWSVACELDLALFNPRFESSGDSDILYGAGQEAFWTNSAYEFLVHASHESSITITGDWLLPAFEREVPQCRNHTYRGPIPTPDQRGTC
ncbi:MAG: hypothetical protein JNM66_08785 [Bryobacterales bacterium]|nr:hypothetical protein [Bryobacterales bacterium]